METPGTQARRFFVSGRVQGVGYRMFAQGAAEELALEGFVRNRRDGRVEVFAMGDEETLHKLRNALVKGPLMSRVENLFEEPAVIDIRYEGKFEIEITI